MDVTLGATGEAKKSYGTTNKTHIHSIRRAVYTIGLLRLVVALSFCPNNIKTTIQPYACLVLLVLLGGVK